jgi:hypothetical protein
MAFADSSPPLARSPFQAQGEVSPGKNAIFLRTTAGFTLPPLDHKSFAVFGLLALVGLASYPMLVHRLADSFHASFPRSVTLAQLHFPSFAVVSLGEDFHLQDRAHAGRTKVSGAQRRAGCSGSAQVCPADARPLGCPVMPHRSGCLEQKLHFHSVVRKFDLSLGRAIENTGHKQSRCVGMDCLYVSSYSTGCLPNGNGPSPA